MGQNKVRVVQPEKKMIIDMLCFRGLKFDSSGMCVVLLYVIVVIDHAPIRTRRHDSTLLLPQSEKEVFELLGLAYVHPRLRNADG